MQNDSEVSSEERHREGLRLLDQGEGQRGFEALSHVYHSAPDNARYRSSYALALALIRGQFLGAVELARASVRQEFHNPDLYLNLSRIYLAFNFRAEAIRFLRRGLMVDPDHQPVRRKLAELGLRRRPLFRSLPRNHPVNRWLGLVQSRVFGGAGELSVPRSQDA